MKICLLINIPVPYRIPVFDIISSKLGNDFSVIYFAKKEPNRKWKLENLKHNHIFLKENISEKDDGFNYVHNNFEVFTHLRRINPDCIITTGFNPTHLYGWLYSKLFFKKHIYWSDGTLFTEKSLGWKHRLLRKIIFNTTYSFLGPSEDNKKLYMSYGVDEEKIFKTHLAVDNNSFLSSNSFLNRKYDLMFSGQFTERKIPLFFVDIIKNISLNKKINVLLIGDGPLKKDILDRLNNLENVTINYPGFVAQDELPNYYSNSKLFLFTTRLDAWGVVANESLASGTPVLVTPYAGVANDLVRNDENGYILDIDKEIWSRKIVQILNDENLWNRLSKNAVKSVKNYTFENAADGIISACNYKNKA